MKAGSRAGLTLIEVLIAVSLLSLLSIGVLWSMRIGFNTMDKTDNRLVHNRRVANARKIIENELNGYLSTLATLHPDGLASITLPFVQAEPRVMRFVTNYSLEDGWRGKMQLVTLHVVPIPNRPGMRLVMEEVPYTGPDQLGQLVTGTETDPKTGALRMSFVEPSTGPGSFVLADQLAECRFSYLERIAIPPSQIWRSQWDNAYNLPRALRVEMSPLETTDNADLRVSSVSIALPVTRSQRRTFRDE